MNFPYGNAFCTGNSYVLAATKLVKNSEKVSVFFLAVFNEKIPKINYLNYMKRRIKSTLYDIRIIGKYTVQMGRHYACSTSVSATHSFKYRMFYTLLLDSL